MFTKKEYRRNEKNNLHTENSLQLVNSFGTNEEKEEMEKISCQHKKQGFLTLEQTDRRYKISNKYYSLLN